VALWFGFTHCCCDLVNPEVVIEGSAGRAVWTYEKICTVRPAAGPERTHPLPASIDTRRVMLAQVLRRLGDSAVAVCTTAMAEPHTALIGAVHAAAPVRNFPPDLIEWITPPGAASPVPAVRGVEAAMEMAGRQQRLLREIGFPLGVAMAV
jgi:hypothetical protein